MAVGLKDSILESVKMSLGVCDENITEFDHDILININAAISVLTQLGVGPLMGYIVTSNIETYEDFLGEDEHHVIGMVELYLYQKTRLGFDPPANSFLVEAVKESIRELEWRLNIQVECPEAFKPEKSDE